MSGQNWYVVHTKPHKEEMALENLERQGFTAYCPRTIQSKRRRHHWQKVIEPLFPRYLFIQLNAGIDNFSPVRSTLGVVGLVRFGNAPAVIPQMAIDIIRLQEQKIQGTSVEYLPWAKGDSLEIIEGPLAGLRAVFCNACGEERVMVMLEMLGRSNTMILHAADVISV